MHNHHKKYTALAAGLLINMVILAQTTGIPAGAAIVAENHAVKCKDSLQLSYNEQIALKAININLFIQKQAARVANTNQSLLQKAVQQIENHRDSLYQLVLPPDKFVLYKTKKTSLLSN